MSHYMTINDNKQWKYEGENHNNVFCSKIEIGKTYNSQLLQQVKRKDSDLILDNLISRTQFCKI